MPIHYFHMTVRNLPAVHLHEVATVSALADELRTYLESIEQEIDQAHRPGAQSKRIQELVGGWLRDHAFQEEYLHAFLETPGAQSRPDFYLDLGHGRGVLAEIERGGAVTNNHDLKPDASTILRQLSREISVQRPPGSRSDPTRGRPGLTAPS